MNSSRSIFYNVVFLITIVGLSACDQASTTVVSIPNVRIECDNSSNSDCNASRDGVSAFVIMARSPCDDPDNVFDPVTSGNTTLDCDSSGCSGVVSSWSGGVSEVVTGSMEICSHINMDPNIHKSSGDLVNLSTLNISSDQTLTIDTWTVQ